MTNEQKNQVAAMNASGMSVDEIVIDTKLPRAEVEAFIAERKKKSDLSTFTVVEIKKNSGRGQSISEQTKQAVKEWWQSGHSEGQTAKKFGISQSSVHRIVTAEKEKEPAPAPTETSSEVSDKADINSLQEHNITEKPKSQALRGVEMIGIMQSMLIAAEESLGGSIEIMSLKADSDIANLMFRYGGTAYSVQFGLAF